MAAQQSFAMQCASARVSQTVPGQAALQHGGSGHDYARTNVVQVLRGLEMSDMLEHEGIRSLYVHGTRLSWHYFTVQCAKTLVMQAK